MTQTDRISERPFASAERTSQVDPDSAAVMAAITNKRQHEVATRAAMKRHRSCRRRFVDPTTTEDDYSEAETEFMLAMAEYKKSSGRMFPTWSEVLEVLQSLGYQKA
jgi:hypothetical protein